MTWLGTQIVRLGQCTSTNERALALALAEQGAAAAAHGLVVVADSQTAGRGRLGRTWSSPAGRNLYFSCLMRPPIPAAAIPPITLAVGIGVCDAVRQFGVDATLKWPNDLMIDGGKLGGILTEMVTRGDGGVDHVVVGIGVNVNQHAFPAHLAGIATSMAAVACSPVDRDDVFRACLEHLETWLDRFFDGGVPAIADAWCERSAMIGAVVTTEYGQGMARGLSGGGGLVVDMDDGDTKIISAGDVHSVPTGQGQKSQKVRS